MKNANPMFNFSVEKNHQLISERGISFEEIIAALDNDKLLDALEHSNIEKYPHQKIYVVDVNGYVSLVPFVRINKQEVFLKTIFPSRKLTKTYLRQEGV